MTKIGKKEYSARVIATCWHRSYSEGRYQSILAVMLIFWTRMEIICIHTKAPKINCGKSWQHSFSNLIHCFYALFLGWGAKLNLTEAKTKHK